MGPARRGAYNARMLRWAVIFLVIAIVAGLFGLTGVSEAASSIAKGLFTLFLILFALALIFGLWTGSKLG